MELIPNTIYQGDCVEIMNALPEKSVDLVFADPPYNLQLRNELYRPNLSHVDAVDDGWDQFMSFDAYDVLTRDWLTACRRLLKDTGTLWVIGTYHNIYRVGAILQDLGYWILNDIVWIKSNPMPNFRGVRFCNAHETLLWAKKSEKQERYTFNYKGLKAGNDDLQMRSDWYFPICSGGERLRSSSGEKVHTTQKPEALLHRIIRACSHPGDLILDPFFGSGTAGAVAKRLGRYYIGIERETDYIDAAGARIASVTPPLIDSLDHPIEPPIRVAFSAVVEMGLIREGTRLRLDNKDIWAVVQADGMLVSNRIHGSIHGVGKELLGTAGCNGWEHWWYEDSNGEFRPLEGLRKQARELMERK